MAPVNTKRRRVEDEVRRPKKKIRVRKQPAYHSSSEDEGEEDVAEEQRPQKANPRSILKQSAQSKQKQVVEEEDEDEASASEIEGLEDLDEAQRNAALNVIPGAEGDESGEDDEQASDEDADIGDSEVDNLDESSADEDEVTPSETSLTSSQAAKRKRNDPAAFATSISRILDTKLTTAKRADPVLSRSKTAAEANKSIQDSKLDSAARAQIRSERKAALNKGRVTDLLGLEDTGVDTGKVVEEEKRLKKIAQRGVVKLFNAVRAAQVGAERAQKESQGGDGGGGVVGRKQREERVSEMSKEGFLEMISKGRGAAA
ncbi:pre-60S ribosomal particles component [Saxophila tyrrhenica]|uniref:Pre-60S ribosomal particles component n=1 Tax=Saxophila tyrrhenica TaxID=1690608 RepID=A0AAV9P547_9PEZI|nr:pre-60S ribosomal particles component [Saxophila tyrrhenica]